MKSHKEREALRRQVREQIDLSHTILTGIEVVLAGKYLREHVIGRYYAAQVSHDFEEGRGIARAYVAAAREHLKLTREPSCPERTAALDRALAANASRAGMMPTSFDASSFSSVLAAASRMIDKVNPADVEQLTILAPDDGGDPGDGSTPPREPDPPLPPPDSPVDSEPVEPPPFDQLPPEMQAAGQEQWNNLKPDIDPVINEAIGIAQGGGTVDIGSVNGFITSIVAGAAASIGGPVGVALSALATILIPRMLTAIENEIIGFEI